MSFSPGYQKDYAAEIRKITYKEVAIFWNIEDANAQKRLYILRHLLNKTGIQWLSKEQYCSAEDITVQEFDNRIYAYYNSLKKKTA